MAKDQTNIEDGLYKASCSICQEGRSTQDIWSAEFGWILRNGQPTEAAGGFYKKYILKEE